MRISPEALFYIGGGAALGIGYGATVAKTTTPPPGTSNRSKFLSDVQLFTLLGGVMGMASAGFGLPPGSNRIPKFIGVGIAVGAAIGAIAGATHIAAT